MTTRRDFLIAGSAAAAMLALPGCSQATVRARTGKPLRILVLGSRTGTRGADSPRRQAHGIAIKIEWG